MNGAYVRMSEIEVKIIDIDGAKVQQRLVDLGALKVFDGKVETYFYDFDDRSITGRGNLLRLRKQGDKVALTYKSLVPSQKAKVTKEYEVTVSDLGSITHILTSLGLNVLHCMKKRRKSYTLNDVRFDFDRYEEPYDYIPEFVEIEAKDIDTIHEYAKLIGFGIEDCKPWSTADLVNHYSKST